MRAARCIISRQACVTEKDPSIERTRHHSGLRVAARATTTPGCNSDLWSVQKRSFCLREKKDNCLKERGMKG